MLDGIARLRTLDQIAYAAPLYLVHDLRRVRQSGTQRPRRFSLAGRDEIHANEAGANRQESRSHVKGHRLPADAPKAF